jgi:sugar/nucleoside kinase (ribokinase family)
VVASIIVDLSSGDRSVVYSNTDVRKLRPDGINESLLDDADILMVDGFYLPQALQLAELARMMLIPTVLDGGSWKEGMDELLPLIDFAVCSSDFHPPGCNDPDTVIARLEAHGISNIAITRGGQPVIALSKGERAEIPVMKIKPLDTLGAGDIFHGAFCHYVLEQDFLTSLTRAAEVASMSCTSLGTRAWIEQEKFI